MEVFEVIGNMFLYYLCFLGCTKFIERIIEKYERSKKSFKFNQDSKVEKISK